MGNRWIVLIDKTPRGPLSESEVKALLQEGVIRSNDVAYQVGDKESGQKAEWKFLWQFNEFDRRGNGEKKTEHFPRIERRTPKAPEHIEEEKSALLPQEIASIQPEDLTYGHGKSMMEKAADAAEEEQKTVLPPMNLGGGESILEMAWNHTGSRYFRLSSF